MSNEANCDCGEMEYCPVCMPVIQTVTREQRTEYDFEVRVAALGTSDEFHDEGDAQELAVHMARHGHVPEIFKRTREVTVVTGGWEQIKAITSAEADQMMAGEVSE